MNLSVATVCRHYLHISYEAAFCTEQTWLGLSLRFVIKLRKTVWSSLYFNKFLKVKVWLSLYTNHEYVWENGHRAAVSAKLGTKFGFMVILALWPLDRGGKRPSIPTAQEAARSQIRSSSFGEKRNLFCSSRDSNYDFSDVRPEA